MSKSLCFFTLVFSSLKLDGRADGAVDSREKLLEFCFDYSYWSVDPADPHYASQEEVMTVLPHWLCLHEPQRPRLDLILNEIILQLFNIFLSPEFSRLHAMGHSAVQIMTEFSLHGVLQHLSLHPVFNL